MTYVTINLNETNLNESINSHIETIASGINAAEYCSAHSHYRAVYKVVKFSTSKLHVGLNARIEIKQHIPMLSFWYFLVFFPMGISPDHAKCKILLQCFLFPF